jgi:uncharacterized membrane protein YidH (DUF202 family)
VRPVKPTIDDTIRKTGRPDRAALLHQGATTMAKDANGTEVKSAVQARGAERGPTTRNVLVLSVGLVVVAFAVIFLVFFKT